MGCRPNISGSGFVVRKGPGLFRPFSLKIVNFAIEILRRMRIDKSVRVALVVAIAFFMQFLDTTAVNTAIPAMARAFGTDVIHLSTGITSYLIALAIFIPVSGWIADRFGTRNVFCAAIVFFILSSTLCGTSQSLLQFVIYRVMQGMAGAMM